MDDVEPYVAGVLLAAGRGSRYGGPKAVAHDPDGAGWLLRSVAALRPCASVTVVLGASADEAAALAPADVEIVVAERWSDGMGASLRAALAALEPTDADIALISLVDLVDVGADVVRRLVRSLPTPSGARSTLARAGYRGRPGHPVLIGRDHWAGVAEAAIGDRGARDYLATRAVHLVECGDLARGHDVDSPG